MYEEIRNRHNRFTSGKSLDDLALRVENAVEKLVRPDLDDAIAIAHHHSDTGAGTNTNGVEGIEVLEVEVVGRPRENGLKAKADSGIMSLSSPMGCALPS